MSKAKPGFGKIYKAYAHVREAQQMRQMAGFRVTARHVKKVLGGLNTNKSVNGVSPRLLKECRDELAGPLYDLFQRIVREGTFPAHWKRSRVTALHKRDSPKLAANYRPVSVLPNVSLIFERVLDDQFDRHMTSCIPDSQFG